MRESWRALLVVTSAALLLCIAGQGLVDDATFFLASGDIPAQRAALMKLFDAVGKRSDLAFANSSLSSIGYAGTSAWGAPNVSYCWWWGVSCCGQTLTTELQICSQGTDGPQAGQSVSSLELAAVGLAGTLPDVFAGLPDLQVLDLAYNRGEARRAGR